MQEKVVVHFKDGKTMRGTTQDFDPKEEAFHLLPCEGVQHYAIDNRSIVWQRDQHSVGGVGYLADACYDSER